ncbi:MAG: hypothetical protein HYX76_12465 [Acidobacteria bacterium]|nr:hypothetical protein [Acidobacteriota bacterium]
MKLTPGGDYDGDYAWHTFYALPGRRIALDGNETICAVGWGGYWQGPNSAEPLHAYSGDGSDLQVMTLGDRDLAAISVSNPPAVMLLNQGFSVTDTTKNVGGIAVPASTTRYYLSTDTVKSSSDVLLGGSRSVVALAASQAKTGTKTAKAPVSAQAGVYYLLACADDRKVIPESDETNNCVASASTGEVRAPDLVVTSVSDPPASAALGSTFSLTDTTLNQGGADAVSSTTRFYLSTDKKKSGTDKLLGGSRVAGALAAGASSSDETVVTVPLTTVVRQYYVLACADDLRQVVESNAAGTGEKNNCVASAAKVTITP